MIGKKKNYLNLFKKKKGKEETAKQNARDKKLIEEYQKKIHEKLKDPESLKKAANIIEEMLRDPGKKSA
jgi:hypothetical protein